MLKLVIVHHHFRPGGVRRGRVDHGATPGQGDPET